MLICLAAAIIIFSATFAEAKEEKKKKVEVSSTEQVEFVSDGMVRLMKSFGEVQVEGWEKNVVEVTVTKSVKADDNPKDQDKAREKLDRIKVSISKEAADSLLISSVVPFRRGLELSFKIKVPKKSDLFIKHDIGEVNVSNVTGNFEITARIGGIDLDLRDGPDYNIDAKVKLGGVESAFSGKSKRSFLLSEKFVAEGKKESYRIYARVGIGEIAISKNIGKVVAPPIQ